MKKLTTICLLALIFGIMSSPAFALSFKFDFYGGDTSYTQGDFEDPQEIYLDEYETVMVDIWLVDWPEVRPNIRTVQYHFMWHKDSLGVESLTSNNPDWQLYADSLVEDGDYLLGLTIMFGGGVVGPDVLLHTIELRCEVAPSDDWIKATLGPDGYVQDMNYVQYFDVVDGDGIIHQIHVDTDGDGVDDSNDNCPNHPNGLLLGTCIYGTIGETCTSNEECDLEGGDGFCSMDQEDSYPPGGNGIGDACECEGDFNKDGNVDAADVTIFLQDFGRSEYNNPCP